MEEEKPIELRSGELNEVLGSIPPGILRYGLTVITGLIVILLAGSYVIKYPEIISSTMVLTGTTPPSAVVSKTNGRLLHIYTSDNSEVKQDETLALIENPASYDDVLLLKNYVEELLQNPDDIELLPKRELKLGNIQQSYYSLAGLLDKYKKFIRLNYYPQKITLIKDRITENRNYLEELTGQTAIIEMQYEVAVSNYKRDSVLYVSSAISGVEINNAKTEYLQSKLALKNSYSLLKNTQIQIKQIEENLLDIEQQLNDQLSAFSSDINNLAVQLMNDINTWELTYLLTAPINGKVSFNSYWSENQNVKSEETVFTVIPDDEEEFVGKALLPVQRSGKVKTGQKVNIRFLNFPENEFGIVKGTVKNISMVPVDNNYTVEISLPGGLLTTYNKRLTFSQEMQAQADIITDDLRLIERLFNPIKKIISESL